ncbi:unnamed protein product [Tilletia controversa]|nr:unnamed protein product [Tilletia controversa]
MAVYVIASAMCEFFADFLRASVLFPSLPLETISSAASPVLPRRESSAFGGFYAGFCPILFKQIPYNTGKFATMKVILEIALKFTNNKKADLSGGEATVYKLGSGLIAGFATARHYHLAARRHSKALPGDTVTSRLVKMSGESGVRGLFTGLSTRLIMVG